MSVTLDWRGDRIEGQMRRRFQGVLASRLAPLLLASLRQKTPVDTGRLRAAWEVIPDARRVRLTIRNATPYAGYVEFGTRRHPPVAMLRRTLDEFAPQLRAELERAMGRR